MIGGDRSLLRMRLLALAILLAVFVAGGLTGVAWERTAGRGEPRMGVRERVGPGQRGEPRRRPPNIFAAGSPLAERLDLTPEQSRRIEAIVEADRTKAQADFEEMEPRLRARFDSTRAAIAAVLTPEQRAEFERLQGERRRRLRERFGGDAPDGEQRRLPGLPPR